MRSPACSGPLWASFSLHTLVTGCSLLPHTESGPLAPDPGSPPGIRLTSPSNQVEASLRVVPRGAAHISARMVPAFNRTPQRGPRRAPGGPQGWEGAPLFLAQNLIQPWGSRQEGVQVTPAASQDARPLSLPLAPTEPCSNSRVLWGGLGSPHGVTEPHSGAGPCAGPPLDTFSCLGIRGWGSPLRVSSRMRAAHPAGLLAPAPISAAHALGTPAQPSRLGKTSHFLFVSTVCLLRVARQGAGRPSPHGPAAPRRDLITLFSWFRFCFLIKKKKKKMTPLGSGPRPCDVPPQQASL